MTVPPLIDKLNAEYEANKYRYQKQRKIYFSICGLAIVIAVLCSI